MTQHARVVQLWGGDEDAIKQVSAACRLVDELCEPCALYDVVVTQLVEVAGDNDVRHLRDCEEGSKAVGEKDTWSRRR